MERLTVCGLRIILKLWNNGGDYMEDLLRILNEVKPGVDFTKEDDLIESGILDSLSIIQLVTKISDEFDVEITPVDLVPENFKSAETIYEMIKNAED